MWVGAEIEGDVAIRGKQTLFIRQMLPTELPSLIKKFPDHRVWFCKEFKHWDTVRRFLKSCFPEICIEVTWETWSKVPADLRAKCTIFFKLPVELKEGDFICVGPAFADEALKIGTGHKVKPEEYLKDELV